MLRHNDHRKALPQFLALAGGLLLALLAPGNAGAQSGSAPATQAAARANDPLRGQQYVKPFRMIGNLYYVGLSNNTSFLITTPEGHFLIDAIYETAVPQIRKNIEDLGFNIRDVKYVLNAHAHSDHVDGLAAMKEATGGLVPVMDGDVPVIEAGGEAARPARWKPVKPDRILHDGDTITLGGVTMTAHKTAGHTKGCTTWTTTIEDGGRKYNAVFICSMNSSNVGNLIGNANYPNIAEDFAAAFAKLKAMPCEVFTVSHTAMFNMMDKMQKLSAGGPNPFIDPQGCKKYIDDSERAYLDKLAKERAGQ
ncbi:MAG TPA: subclass B3 metallo-beta-lactamase [Terriglobia bacterium]|nr:subclass B3 metallo-beta-lactamase [Terriglobia bacterium]